MKYATVLVVAIATISILIISSVNAEADNFKVVGYISWQNLDKVWDYGNSLIDEKSLNYLTDIVGPAINWTSASNMTLKGMYGSLSTLNYVAKSADKYGLDCRPYLYGTGAELADLVENGLDDDLAINIKNLLNEYDMDGIELDIEEEVSQSDLGSLIDELYSQLNPLGKKISVAGTSEVNSPNLTVSESSKVDRINVMCYDLWGYSDMTSEGYPHSTYPDSVAVMQRWLDWGFDRNKLLMGIPFYGSSTDGDHYNYSQIVSALNPSNDQNTGKISGHTIWWGGIDTTKQKVDWAYQNLAGVMVFTVGYDYLNDSKSLLKTAIYNEIQELRGTPTNTPSMVAPVIQTLTAENINSHGATLNGNLSNLGSANSVEVFFDIGKTSDYGGSLQATGSPKTSTGTFSLVVTGLDSNTVYHYRSKGIGDSISYGNDMIFRTLNNPYVSTTPTETTTPSESKTGVDMGGFREIIILIIVFLLSGSGTVLFVYLKKRKG